MNYLLEILAFFGVVVSLMGMFTCMNLGASGGLSKGSESEPIDSDTSFYSGFEQMKNPFYETQNSKDPSLSLAEEMDKEKDRMDV